MVGARFQSHASDGRWCGYNDASVVLGDRGETMSGDQQKMSARDEFVAAIEAGRAAVVDADPNYNPYLAAKARHEAGLVRTAMRLANKVSPDKKPNEQ